jgi:hypothetical protein
MSEFGLELPTTKMGADGKGERAVIVKQSYAKVIGAVFVVSLLCAGLLFVDLRNEETQHALEIQHEHRVEEHQRYSKLEAEKTMTQVAFDLQSQVQDQLDLESDLKIMAQSIDYEHTSARSKLMKAVDDPKATVEDIKKLMTSEFDTMNKKVMFILNALNEKAKEKADEATVNAQRVQNQVMHEVEKQEKRDSALEQERQNKANGIAASPAEEAEEDAELESADAQINGQLRAVFDHVNTLAEKMGNTDIDPLLDEKNVKEWEQLLTDAETGKVSYPDAVAKMEKILADAPAALKLADATGAIELVEEDGGKKGVNELANFRNLLKQVKRLPEYATVLQEFTAWKDGKRTIQQVLLWTQKQIAAGKIDPAWMAKAYERVSGAKPVATSNARPGAAATAAHRPSASIGVANLNSIGIL